MKEKKHNDLTGQVFGRLTVIGFSHVGDDGRLRYWDCQCECGNRKAIPEISLLSGSANSCGCLRKEIAAELMTTHGESRSPLYRVWARLKSVCYNESYKEYPSYGAKGIKVCEAWMGYEGFRAWAYENGYSPDKKLRLMRIDTEGDFTPGNCKWQASSPQTDKVEDIPRKKRSTRSDLKEQGEDECQKDIVAAPRNDLTGQVFGRLTVLGFSHKKGTVKYWRCRCECGNERTVAAQSLLSGASKSCGCLRALRRKDLTGQVFGKLTVLGYAGSNGFVSLWRCRCECGNEIVLPRGSLTTGATRSCGCLKRGPKMKGKGKMDIIGKRFGRLTVIAFDGIRGRRASYWLCRCDCGNEKVITRSSLISGNTRSCGCLKKEIKSNMTHGGTNTDLYKRWNRIKHDPKSTMCDEWMEFPAFKDWALANGYEEDKGLYLHREIPREGYTPENCTWIPRGEHFREGYNNATRKKLAYGGLMMKTTEWAKLLGVRKEVLYQRLYRYDKDLARVCKIPFDGKQVDLDTIVEAEKKRLAGNVLSFR